MTRFGIPAALPPAPKAALGAPMSEAVLGRRMADMARAEGKVAALPPSPPGRTPSVVRVLAFIEAHGPVSRAAVVKGARLGLSTVQEAVVRLMEQGEVEEVVTQRGSRRFADLRVREGSE